MSKKTTIIIIAVIVLLAGAFAAWYFTRKKATDSETDNHFVTDNIINIRNKNGKIIGQKTITGKMSDNDKKDAIKDASAKLKNTGFLLPGIKK